MTSNEENAPTSAGLGPSDETTVVPLPSGAAPELAWSAEEPETWPLRHSWSDTWGHAGVIAACGAVVAVVIGFAGYAVLTADDGGIGTTVHPTVPSTMPAAALPPIASEAAPPPAPEPQVASPTPAATIHFRHSDGNACPTHDGAGRA
jgi:hypothetical protein